MVWRRLLTGALLALALAACGIGSGGEPPTPMPGALFVEMSEMKFEPEEIRVQAGESVTIQLYNDGSVKHDFSIDALDLRASLSAGGSTLLDFEAPAEPGEYEIHCSVPGHEDSGMTGTLIVE